MAVWRFPGGMQHCACFLSQAAWDLYKARDLALLLFRQRIAERYRHSVLGLMWAVLPTAAVAGLFTLSKSWLSAGASTGDAVPQLNVILGVLLVQSFLEAFQAQRGFYFEYRHWLRHQKFPIAGIILSHLAESVLETAIKSLVFAIAMTMYGVAPHATFLMAPVCMGIMVLSGAGFGLWLAPVSALSRDVDHIMKLLPWLLFILLPVFTPWNHDGVFYRFHLLNFPAWVLESARFWTLGNGEAHPLVLWMLPASVVLSAGGWLACRFSTPFVVERLMG